MLVLRNLAAALTILGGSFPIKDDIRKFNTKRIRNKSTLKRAARRLNTNIPRAELYYINRLEELIMKHKIVERVGQAHENSTSKAWDLRSSPFCVGLSNVVLDRA